MPADATSPVSGEQPTPADRPLLGKVVDQRYRVLSHVGSGGMADVYEVEHVALGRKLAMKVLRQTRSANPQLARRFSREARAASRLDSEHVVAIHDYGLLPEGFPYFVMDLLHGQNLRCLLEVEPKLPVARAVNIAIDVCLGLHAAHSAGLVHRDLKPENLWLTRGDDGRELCILLDFGVARFDGAHTTGDGVLVGTARYMSPEQIGSDRPPGPASDLFSLGLLLYESLTGVPPFAADSLERTLFRILNDAPRSASELNPEVSAELTSVLEKALAKDPDQRYGEALAFAAALRPFAGVARLLPSLAGVGGLGLSDETLAEEPIVNARPYGEAAPDSERVAKPASKRAVPLAFGVGLLLGGLALLAFRPQSKPPEPPSVSLSRTPVATTAATGTSSEAVTPDAPAPRATPSAPAPREPASRAQPQRSKPHLAPIAPASAPKPTRPEPPRPNFDGRNPYLQ